MGEEHKRIENASKEDLVRGYTEDKLSYRCLLCGEHFTKGEIYHIEERWFDAEKAILYHIDKSHTSVLTYLLHESGSISGLSQLQLQIISLFASGLSDKEIAQYLQVAGSTIRNHRYKLREKEKQAHVFLAIMELLDRKREERKEDKGYENALRVEEVASGDCKVKEKDRGEIVLERYVTQEGVLRSYPAKEGVQKILLNHIITQFQKGKRYTDIEVNSILKDMYMDYEVLKRDLLTYELLGRSEKGGIYWVKGA